MVDSASMSQAYMAATNTTSLPNTKGITNPEEARKTAKEFEAVFLSQMLKPMFENLQAEEPFGGGMGEELWRSVQVDEYGKAIANAGGIGLADNIYREMIKQQEVQ